MQSEIYPPWFTGRQTAQSVSPICHKPHGKLNRLSGQEKIHKVRLLHNYRARRAFLLGLLCSCTFVLLNQTSERIFVCPTERIHFSRADEKLRHKGKIFSELELLQSMQTWMFSLILRLALKVGMELMPYSWASSRHWSTSIWQNITSVYSAASCLKVGLKLMHGPHHVA